MKKMILTLGFLLLLALHSLAQDPDYAITVGTVYVDSGMTDVWVPVYLTAIDTFCFMNSPISWSPLNSGIFPVDVIPVMVPPCNNIHDSIYIDDGLIEIGGGFCDSGSSQLLVQIRFSIDPGASPQILTLYAGNSPRNGGPLFGFCDGLTSVVPIFISGYIYYGMPNSADEHSPAVPISFSLDQNYPNPFAPKTYVSFENGIDQPMRLDIYNIRGQLVDVLINDYLYKGHYTFHWDGIDIEGQDVPSGIYYYSLSNGRESIVKKVILLR